MVVNEKFSFKDSFLIYAIIMLELPTLVLILVLWQKGTLGEGGPLVVAIVVSIMTLLFSFFLIFKVELRIDSDSLSYKNPPLINRWMKIYKNEILNISVKKSGGIFDYGGIGVKYSAKQTAYIFPASHVIEVQLTNKKIVFSTKRPEDIERIIQSWESDYNVE